MDLKKELKLLVEKCIGEHDNYMIDRMIDAICLGNEKNKKDVLLEFQKWFQNKGTNNIPLVKHINEFMLIDSENKTNK